MSGCLNVNKSLAERMLFVVVIAVAAVFVVVVVFVLVSKPIPCLAARF